MSRRHVLVGSGIAALSAAEAIRQAEPRASITVVGMEPAGFYSRPGLAYYLTEELPAPQLALRTERELAALRLERIVGRATSLVPARHLLYLEDGEGSEALKAAAGRHPGQSSPVVGRTPNKEFKFFSR